MHITEIKAGKKYYQLLATNTSNRHTSKKVRTVNTFYVLEVDEASKRVLASLNGAPAQYFAQSKFVRWVATKPENI